MRAAAALSAVHLAEDDAAQYSAKASAKTAAPPVPAGKAGGYGGSGVTRSLPRALVKNRIITAQGRFAAGFPFPGRLGCGLLLG